jgi:hypothetical protein
VELRKLRLAAKGEAEQLTSINNSKNIPINATIRQEYIKCGKRNCLGRHGPYHCAYWKAKQQPYNATENTISAFKTADSLLIQALNDLNIGKTQEAHTQLSMAKTQIEQYQLASLDAMSNPGLQLSREHLLAAETGSEGRKY